MFVACSAGNKVVPFWEKTKCLYKLSLKQWPECHIVRSDLHLPKQSTYVIVNHMELNPHTKWHDNPVFWVFFVAVRYCLNNPIKDFWQYLIGHGTDTWLLLWDTKKQSSTNNLSLQFSPFGWYMLSYQRIMLLTECVNLSSSHLLRCFSKL